MKLGFTVLAMSVVLNGGLLAAQQQQTVPDAPVPQAQPKLNGLGAMTPGLGTSKDSTSSSSDESAAPKAAATPQQKPAETSSQAPSTDGPDTVQTSAPEMPESGTGYEKTSEILRVRVNFVEVPVTVKDTKGTLVAGLTYRDFKVFENDTREPLTLFTVDPFPLSVVFVVDQSLTSDVMAKVNNSLGAIQGALTPYDEVSVFSYANGAHNQSGGFTGAQSARVPYILSMTKAAGEEMLVPVNSGPLAGCSVTKNGNCVDPNIQVGHSAGGTGGWMTIPKEIHTLNDAILAAGKELSTRPKGRRRIIYVISDGKEAGSKATYKDVLKYLQTNDITVYGTAVGDSARWGEGYISRFHIPFTMYDNRLASYVIATGGTLDSEGSTNGIERSYAKIAEEARARYTLGYNSHQPVIDGKYRKIDVRVDRPGLEVIARHGYYPNARDQQ